MTLLRDHPLDHLEMTAEDSEPKWTVAVVVPGDEGGALRVQQLDHFEVAAGSSVVHCGGGRRLGWVGALGVPVLE
eukprot:scaffold75378_cov63-Phaeocystis_antarctica.AAC.5